MCHVGIDVAQATLDVVVVDAAQQQRWQVPNTPAGICRLVTQVQATGCLQIALEPTGPYHVPVAEALQRAGLPVGLVGPAELHAYRRVLGRRNKTDAADAELLARYAQTQAHALRPVAAVSGEQQRLRALVRYRDQLVQHRVRLSQQREAAAWHGWNEVVVWQDADLAQLRAREQAVTAEIEDQLSQFAESVLLQAMPGVGPLTVASVLAYLPRALWGVAKKAAAYAGLVPELQQSGQQYRSRLTTRGHRRLRHALYNAAGTAIRWDAAMAAYRDRLLAAGHSRKSARCACAHRLLRQMMGRLRAFAAQQAAAAT